jgi:hypothetical protein
MEKNIDAELKVDDPYISNTLYNLHVACMEALDLCEDLSTLMPEDTNNPEKMKNITEFEVDDPKKIESPFLHDRIKGYNPFEGTGPVGIYCAQREIYEEEN